VRQALGFLTIVGRSSTPTGAARAWFAPVGVAVGALVGLAWWGASEAWSPLVAGALVVVADLVVTGALHVDGLADSADGLLPHLPRARRLEVMSAPDVGAFGVATVAATLLLRWAAAASLPISGWRAVALYAGLWAFSRGAMAVAMTAVPYARAGSGGGLASAFVDDRHAQGAGRGRAVQVALLTLIAAGLGSAGCLLGRGFPGAIALCAAALAAAGVVWLAVRRLGGFTGDVLGAAGVVAETVGLVVAAARWR
jgi:adenosylcobinamide-GDP ribazoletransferase